MTIETVQAVPMVRLAEVNDKSVQAVRYWIIRGHIPEAFREHKFMAGNARWMVPLAEAARITKAHGRDPQLLAPHVESVQVGQRPQNKGQQR